MDQTQSISNGGDQYNWSTVTENDTPTAQEIKGGKYTVSVEGAFGGASIEIKYGRAAGNEASVDVDNLTFTENGSYNIEVAQGFILPVRAGGSSTDVDITLTAIAEQ